MKTIAILSAVLFLVAACANFEENLAEFDTGFDDFVKTGFCDDVETVAQEKLDYTVDYTVDCVVEDASTFEAGDNN